MEIKKEGQETAISMLRSEFHGVDTTLPSHWVAANGDRIDTTIAGSGQPTGTPGEFRITDIHTVIGGTGRFAGAHGQFTVERLASGITFATSGSFEGTITSPGAD